MRRHDHDERGWDVTGTGIIPPLLQEALDRELEHGERVRWTGMPKPRLFTPGTVGAFLFAIPWTGFAIFWTCGAAGFKIPKFDKPSDFFPLFGLPFLLIGLGMLSSPWWSYRSALKTLYAITSKRAIIIKRGMSSTSIKNFMPDDLHDLHKVERRDGSGDIFFDSWSGMAPGNNRTVSQGFIGVDDARSVERILRELAEKDDEE